MNHLAQGLWSSEKEIPLPGWFLGWLHLVLVYSGSGARFDGPEFVGENLFFVDHCP